MFNVWSKIDITIDDPMIMSSRIENGTITVSIRLDIGKLILDYFSEVDK